MNIVCRFREVIDALDSPGAHILIAVFLGLIGVLVTGVAEHFHLAETSKAAEVLIGFFAVAGYAMRGNDKATPAPNVSSQEKKQ